MKFKLIFAASLLVLLGIFFTGCGESTANSSENGSLNGSGNNVGNGSVNGSEDSTAKLTLTEIVEKLCTGIDVPPYETVSLNETDFEYFSFVPYADGLTAVAADALVNITPHSLVVIHDDNGNGTEIAKKVAENADLNKWLCVGSEAGNVLYTDHYVVLIMSEKVTVDAITKNFSALSNNLDGMSPGTLSLTNSRYEQ